MLIPSFFESLSCRSKNVFKQLSEVMVALHITFPMIYYPVNGYLCMFFFNHLHSSTVESVLITTSCTIVYSLTGKAFWIHNPEWKAVPYHLILKVSPVDLKYFYRQLSQIMVAFYIMFSVLHLLGNEHLCFLFKHLHSSTVESVLNTISCTIANSLTAYSFLILNSEWKAVPVQPHFEGLSFSSNIRFYAIVWAYRSFIYHVFTVTFTG